MPEEANPPTERGQRRSGRDESEESSGGGGKVIAIILGLLLIVTAFGFYKRNASANARADTDTKSIASLSNQVSELQVKLTLAQSDLEVARTNSLAVLDRRTTDLLTVSNRFAQTSLLLGNVQDEKRTLQNQLATCTASATDLQAERDDLRRQVAAVAHLQQQVTDLTANANQGKFTQASLQEAIGRLQLDKADLERKLNDPAFLRAQTKRAQEQAELIKRTAFHPHTKSTDKRARLELQPDGTVQPTVAVTGPFKRDAAGSPASGTQP